MKTEMFQLDIFTEALIKKIDFENYESALKSIKQSWIQIVFKKILNLIEKW